MYRSYPYGEGTDISSEEEIDTLLKRNLLKGPL